MTPITPVTEVRRRGPRGLARWGAPPRSRESSDPPRQRRRWRGLKAGSGALALAVVAMLGIASSPIAAAESATELPAPEVEQNVAPALPAAAPAQTSAMASPGLPCDVFAAGGNPCVAAYSTVRALVDVYNGPLYRVTRASDGASSDIGLLGSGYADAAAQDAFCQVTVCTIVELYDQSGRGNDLTIAPVGEAGSSAIGARADALPITVDGHDVYGIQVEPRVGYRRAIGNGMAVDGEPESMYWIASGTMATNACCFDFGNVERTSTNTGEGHMDTLIMSTFCGAPPCSGRGPWLQADLENGVFMGDGTSNLANVSQTSPFVTGVLRNDGQTSFALDGGDATEPTLDALFQGSLPPGYTPMKQEGGITLGAGGDNSNAAPGSFFEGAITSGYAPDSSVAALQSDIYSVTYTGTSGGGPGVGITGPGGKCVDVAGDDDGQGGAAVQLWDCLLDAVDQHWLHIRTTPTVHLTSGVDEYPNTLKTMGRCLEVQGDSSVAGTPIQLWDCNGLGGQEWFPQSDGTLLNPQSGQCLTARGASTANGTRLEIQPCAGAASQRFIVTPGLLFQATPIDAPGGKCVDVQGVNTGTNGTAVVVDDCQREANDQSWWSTPDGSLTTLGRCLDIVGNGTSPGTAVQLYDCNGSGGQQWVQQGDGALLNPQSGLCLHDATSGTANGTVLSIERCDGSSAQGFKVSGGQMVASPGGTCMDTAGDDTYGNWSGPAVQLWDCIEHAADQHWIHTSDNTLETMTRCLDVAGNSTTAGTPVILFNCNGVGGQQWVQQADGSMLNPPSGLCLTAPGSGTNGTQLTIDVCTGGSQQKFVLQGTAALQPGSEVSLRATTSCCTNDFVRHQFGDAVLSTVTASSPTATKQDASWTVREGLADSTCLSLESVNYPGGYLRRQGDTVHQDQDDGTAQFESDATFCPEPGAAGEGVSLRTLADPSLYLRHFNGDLYAAANGGPDPWDSPTSWADDATWNPAVAWAS